RRHTRSKRDWSSDVCSSDLKHPHIPYPNDLYSPLRPNSSGLDLANDADLATLNKIASDLASTQFQAAAMGTAFTQPDTTHTVQRSEERRVGREYRSR